MNNYLMVIVAVLSVFLIQGCACPKSVETDYESYHSDPSDGGGGGPRLPTLPKCKSKVQCGI